MKKVNKKYYLEYSLKINSVFKLKIIYLPRQKFVKKIIVFYIELYIVKND